MSFRPASPSGVVAPLLTVALLLSFLWLAVDRVYRPSRFPLPPGPRPLPIIGNLLNFPKSRPWLRMRALRLKYGGLIYLRLLGTHTLVIGSADLALEFLEKRSANSADKPPLTPAVEMSGQGISFALTEYGPRWRQLRREFWHYFYPRAVSRYHGIQSIETRRFLVRLLRQPSQVKRHIKTLFTAPMLRILYGMNVTSDADEYATMADAALEAFTIASPGRFAVDVFPFLRHLPAWFPGAEFRTILGDSKRACEQLKNAPFDKARRLFEQGKSAPCVAADMLVRFRGENPGVDHIPPEEEDIMKTVCVTALEGGSDTVNSTLQAFFVAMMLYPEVQKKAQAELDDIVGRDRLPDHGDREALVYVDALIKEVIRWHNIFHLSLPHYTIEDDEFHGYLIPAGTTVMVNIWDILHDPELYDRPYDIWPERYIRNGKLDHTVRDPESFTFGFGRRVCPGRHFAHSALFSAVASVLHVFDVSLPVDENGEEIQVKYRPSDGLMSFPEDCRCAIKLRSAEAEALIVNEQSVHDEVVD